MRRCLITGCEGFIGSHLADFLVERGMEVFGTVYEETMNVKFFPDKLNVLRCDLKDKGQVDKMIAETKPEVIFHLAAQSYVTVSWENPEETLKTNILGSFNLIETARKQNGDTFIEVVGSSAVYGSRDKSELPLREISDFRPTSMYAVSKVAEEMLGYFYNKVYDMNIVLVRPFNMTGPRKTDDACSDFSKGIVEIEKGLKDELQVGNLDTVRDFTDGRDAVRALWRLAEKGKPGNLYNICSGKGRRMADILSLLIRLSGREIKYRVVPEKLRPYDDPIYIGDSSRLQALGWKPEIVFEKTLSDMLGFWRENI